MKKEKADPLVLAPKWHLAYGGQIQVLGTQLLDPVIEQSAQISYRGLYYKTFYGRNLTDFRNKLECLSLASLSSLVYYLWVRPGAYPRVEHFKGASLKKALALPANIRLGCRGLPGMNTLAYYENP